MRGPRGLHLDNEEPLKGTDVGGHRLSLDRHRGTHVLGDGGVLDLGGQIARQRAQKDAHAVGIAAGFAVEPEQVAAGDVLGVVPQMALRLGGRGLQVPGPPSVRQDLERIGHTHRAIQRHWQLLALEQGRQ